MRGIKLCMFVIGCLCLMNHIPISYICIKCFNILSSNAYVNSAAVPQWLICSYKCVDLHRHKYDPSVFAAKVKYYISLEVNFWVDGSGIQNIALCKLLILSPPIQVQRKNYILLYLNYHTLQFLLLWNFH